MKGGQTQSAGARVTINDPTTMALIAEYGMDVLPAKTTNMGMGTVSMTRHIVSYTSMFSFFRLSDFLFV